MQENFSVQNVKCAGCVAAIRDGLVSMPGVSSVEVIIEGGKVTVEGGELNRTVLAAKLAELGYPEV